MSLSRDATAATQRQAIVHVAGLDVVWHSMSGGGLEVEITHNYDVFPPEQVVGLAAYTPIVLTTSVSLHRDLEWMRRVKGLVGTGGFTISRQWTDVNWSPIGAPEVYPDCVLTGYTNPETSPSTDDTLFSLTFAHTGEVL